jgi:hypothetical protein
VQLLPEAAWSVTFWVHQLSVLFSLPAAATLQIKVAHLSIGEDGGVVPGK